MSVSIAVFTRDLRVHDNPTLSAAADAATEIVPLFVLDRAILTGPYNRPNRARFLVESLRDLSRSLADRGAPLVVRHGDVVEQTAKLAADVRAASVHISGDASGYARRRQRRLQQRLQSDARQLVVHDALFVAPPGSVGTTAKDHIAVFTPYFRRWERHPVRDMVAAPRSLRSVGVEPGVIPTANAICTGEASPETPEGGEAAGRQRLSRWLSQGIGDYSDRRDVLADDSTSRLSPYLHFGCLSPVEVLRRALQEPSAGTEEFVRQLCWRDFYAQVLAARPDATTVDYRSRGDRWHVSDEELQAWRSGQTGYPVVDAAMRQLAREGWMPNRARLIVAYFLTKTLYLDWRLGASHFLDLLVDGDVANNTMNWQWCAGTGTDARYNRTYNVTAQARRHDPRGTYVRRYVAELADLDDGYLHEPWLLPDEQFTALGYPLPIVDQDEARERMRRVRTRG